MVRKPRGFVMIYDVKVYTPDGTVKEIITAKTLKKKFWKEILGSTYAMKKLKAKPEKTCVVCENKFDGNVPHAKFCSVKCGKEHLKNNRQRTYRIRVLKANSNAEVINDKVVFNMKCKVCKRITQMLTPDAVFCSRSCSSNRRNEKYIKRTRAKVRAEKNATIQSQWPCK